MTVDPVVDGVAPDAGARLLLHAGVVTRPRRGRPRDAGLIPGHGSVSYSMKTQKDIA